MLSLRRISQWLEPVVPPLKQSSRGVTAGRTTSRVFGWLRQKRNTFSAHRVECLVAHFIAGVITTDSPLPR